MALWTSNGQSVSPSGQRARGHLCHGEAQRWQELLLVNRDGVAVVALVNKPEVTFTAVTHSPAPTSSTGRAVRTTAEHTPRLRSLLLHPRSRVPGLISAHPLTWHVLHASSGVSGDQMISDAQLLIPLPVPSGYRRTHLLTGHAHTHPPGCGHIAAITTVQAHPTGIMAIIKAGGGVFTHAHHVASLATSPFDNTIKS